jgi:hypothetical protein
VGAGATAGAEAGKAAAEKVVKGEHIKSEEQLDNAMAAQLQKTIDNLDNKIMELREMKAKYAEKGKLDRELEVELDGMILNAENARVQAEKVKKMAEEGENVEWKRMAEEGEPM